MTAFGSRRNRPSTSVNRIPSPCNWSSRPTIETADSMLGHRRGIDDAGVGDGELALVGAHARHRREDQLEPAALRRRRRSRSRAARRRRGSRSSGRPRRWPVWATVPSILLPSKIRPEKVPRQPAGEVEIGAQVAEPDVVGDDQLVEREGERLARTGRAAAAAAGVEFGAAQVDHAAGHRDRHRQRRRRGR